MEPIRSFPSFGETVDLLVDSAGSQGSCSVIVQKTKPGGGPPLHQHTKEDETFTVLEGEYELTLNGTKVPMAQGEVFFAPRGSVHTFRNVGTTPGRMMIVITPGGFEGFLQEAGGLNPAQQMGKILETAERFGLSFPRPA